MQKANYCFRVYKKIILQLKELSYQQAVLFFEHTW